MNVRQHKKFIKKCRSKKWITYRRKMFESAEELLLKEYDSAYIIHDKLYRHGSILVWNNSKKHCDTDIKDGCNE